MSLLRRTPLVPRLLSGLHAAVGGRRGGHRLLRWLRVRRLGRAWLRRTVLREARAGPNDVTVVVGVRNRTDHRLANALESLRAQTHPADRIRALVVDYGSEPADARATVDLCRRYGAEYLRVDGAAVWSRGRCLNVGIRRAETTFLMTSDADIVLSPGYLADAVRMLRSEPLSVVCAPMLDLPEETTRTAKRAARTDGALPLEAWRRRAEPRFEWRFHPSIAVTWTSLYRLVRGYDEFYAVWGEEDVDLMDRFRRLGLTPRPIAGDSFYLHQWHPKFEGVPEGEEAAQVRRNREHLERSHSILRNGPDWGVPPGSSPRRDGRLPAPAARR